MPTGDLNDGSRFGLVPIGLPQSNLSTPGSDTERRPMPGLATKNSVFAWRSDAPVLFSRSGAANYIEIVNFRQNTATGGSSVDVPTWAAGAVLAWTLQVLTMGVGVTSQNFTMLSSLTSNNLTSHGYLAVGPGDTHQVLVPFFDEPLLTVGSASGGAPAGTVLQIIYLVGFVRNV